MANARPPAAFLRFAPLLLAAVAPLAALRAQSNYATPYAFTTLAGLASAGSTDGTGSAARFSGPGGVAVDGSGNLFVADANNNLIREVTPAGVVTTIAGSIGNVGSVDGTGSAAQFDQPGNIAIDSAGNLYVADTVNFTIRKITPTVVSGATNWVVTTIAGGSGGNLRTVDGTGSDARFDYPSSVAVDQAGNLYVTDRYTIRQITPTVVNGVTNWVVTTLAGNDYPGYADGTGSAAQFNTPHGIAVDSAGSLYVSDSYNAVIRKVTPTVVSGVTNWVVTTLAGTAGNQGFTDGTGSAARFNQLDGNLAVDSTGNLYVTDWNSIRQITPAGVVATIAGGYGGYADGTGTAASFSWPKGVAVDSAGDLFVADTVNNAIRKITPTVISGVTNWVVTTVAGFADQFGGYADGTGAAAQFSYPEGIAVDSAGNVYVADTAYALIRQITPAGVVTTIAGVPDGNGGYVDGPGSVARFSNPKGIDVDQAGNLYVADLGNNTIRKITPTVVNGVTNWAVTTIAGSAGNSGSTDAAGTAAQFNSPNDVAVDGAGNLYVADTENYTIRKITPTVVSGVTNWVVTTLAGSAGNQGRVDGTGSAAQFDSPFSIAVDSAGNLYAADGSIRKITPAGVVTTIAGITEGPQGSQDGTGSAALFYSPQGIAVDGTGNLYVTDTMNNTIRKITPTVVSGVTNWNVTTIAGAAGSVGWADGIGRAVQFNYPVGIAADSSGDVYVADTENNTIREGVPVVAAPAITAQPVSETVTRGFNASFTATVNGTPVPSIQWQVSTDGGSTWTNLQETGLYSGVTTATLTITGPALSMSGYQYQFVATNSINTVTSAAVTLTVSPTAAPVGSISTKFESTFFLKTDGTLWATGYNYNGQLGDGTTTDRSNFEQVATGVASVAAADSFTMFVKTDHTLWAMGSNELGQLGDGTTTARSTPEQVATGVASVAVGAGHTMFVKTDGTLWAVGNNDDGQLGDGSTTSRSTPEQVATGVASVSAGYGHTMFVKTDGTLWATGLNNHGQLGDGTTANRSTPEQIASGVASVTAGDAHTLFVKTDETLWAAGLNESGQLGDGTTTNRSTFEQVASGVILVAAGVDHTMFIKTDGTLWGTGDDFSGELGDGVALGSTTTSQSTPEQVASGVVSVAAGDSYTMFLKSDGSLWGTGDDFSGELGDGAPIPEDEDISQTRSTPVKVLPLASASFTTQPISQTIALGDNAMLTAVASGTPLPTLKWQVSTNGGSTWTDLAQTSPYPGTNTSTLTVTQPTSAMSGDQYRCVATNVVNAATSNAATLTVNQTGAKVHSAAAGSAHSMVLMTDGTLWATGYNYAGGLGDGTTTDRSTWEQVASGVVSVACGYLHTVFIKSDGTLWAMGSNGSGQLGDGTTTDRNTPVQVATGVASVATGSSFTMFIKTDGTLWAMGFNGWGQLGNGNTTNQSTPIQIASGVASVAAGSLHTVFLKTDGTLWGTGNNGNGELGDGTTAGDGSTSIYGVRTTPEQMASGVASISAGVYRTLFIKTDGTLWGTGWNYYGQLGDGTPTERNTFEQVATSVASVAAGGEHTLLVKTDGTLWATGSNIFGQLGDGTTTNRNTWEQVATSVASVAAGGAGGNHTLFVRTDGTLWAMGENQNGQLGDGTTIDRSIPEQTFGSTNVAPSFTTQPTSSTVTVGGNVSFTIAASETPAPNDQWQVSTDGGSTWTNLTDTAPYSGTATGTLTITGVTTALNGEQFRCVVSNGVSPDATSLPATLTVFALSDQAFLQQLYLDVLGRPIDAGGAATFGAALANGESRADVLGNLLGSAEYSLRQIDPVIRLYYSALARCPDSGGLGAWSNALQAGALTLATAGNAFAGSAEFLQDYGALNNTQFVQQIYLNALGRQADAAGLANCVAYLNAGGSRGSVLIGISESPEGQTNLASRVEIVRLYYLLLKRMPTPAELQSWLGFLQGSDETDVLFALGYPANLTDSNYVQLVYTGFLRRAAGSSELSTFGSALTAQTVTHGSLVTTLLTSAEFNAYVAPVARLYLGGLLRAPDSGGLDNWVAYLRAGNSMQAAGDAFAASAEFAGIYGAMSNSDYVSALYVNILGRQADATGLANWVAMLNGGASRGQVLIGLANSTEAVNRLAPTIRTFLSYDTFLNAAPTQADLDYWNSYLTTLDDQFRDDLLTDPTFASGG
jgi:alpha-tubulin suppressor-like RCC1 family protein